MPCVAAEGAGLIPEPRCSDLPPAGSAKLQALEEVGQRIVRAVPNAAGEHARALWSLVWSRHGQPLDATFRHLETATRRAPADAAIHSDLSAAYLLRAQRLDDPADLVPALRHAAVAAEAAPDSPEALFNRALILSYLQLIGEARKAWRAYLRVDPDSDWAEEARERLAELGRPGAGGEWRPEGLKHAAESGDLESIAVLVRQFPQQLRLYGEEQALPYWAEAVARQAGDDASRRLEVARVIAISLARETGDTLLADSVRAIDGAAGGDVLARLAAGHQLYRRARTFHERQDYEPASDLFQRAAAELKAAGSPFAAWARFYLAVVRYHAAEYSAAAAALDGLGERLRGGGYPALQGHVEWMRGLTRFRLVERGRALDHYRAARTCFERGREIENLSAVDSLIALVYDGLGDTASAWRHHYLALSARKWLRKPRRIQNPLMAAVEGLERIREPRAALFFVDEVVGEARRAGQDLGLAIALRLRADLYRQLGRAEEALADLAAGWERSERLEGEAFRHGVQADLLIVEARVLQSADPRRSIAALDRASELSRARENRYRLLPILRQRSASRLAEGDREGAERDLRRGVAEVERQRALLASADHRQLFLDQTRALFERLIELDIERRAEIAGFEDAERMRARALLDALAPGRRAAPGAPVRGGAEIVAAVPDAAAVIAYLVLGDRVVAWAVCRGRIDFHPLPITAPELIAEVGGFVDAIVEGAPSAGVVARSQRLHQAIIAPLLPAIDGASSLVIVPDGVLWTLPFAALRSAETGRLLVENHSVGLVPSANLWLELHSSAGRRPASPRALLVGGVDFSRQLYPALDPLPFSAVEVDRLAAIYDRRTVLQGKQATVERFLAAVPKHDVVHFAGHARAEAASPRSSSLLLTPGRGEAPDSGTLYASSISFSRRLDTRLVVLSACETAHGTISRSEGQLGLAYPFLAAGVPAVIASLWPVEDRATAEFFTLFHQRYRAGASALEALRAAQVDTLAADPGGALAEWAGFQLYGAGG